MSKKPMTTKAEAEKAVKDIRRATRKVHSAEEKIRIVDWWHKAWLCHPVIAERFRIEARASLPIIEDADDVAAMVFSGVKARRFALRLDQQIPEWHP